MKNSHRKNLARLVVTGSAALVLGLAGSGTAVAASGQELPTIPGQPDCIETGECVPDGVPGAEPDGVPGAEPDGVPGISPTQP
jgi:hypothetical protein